MTKLEDHKQYTDLWWRSLKKEFKSKHIEKSQYNIFLQCYFNYLASQPNKIIAVKSLIDNVLKYPKIIRESYGDFDFNFWKVFGKNWLTLKLISFKNRSICFFRKKWYQLKCLETPKLKLVYPIQRNHFYNEEGHYYISTNSKVMSSTLSVAKNLKQANLKTLLVCNIKKRLGLSPRHKFYLIVRHPSKRLESYYNDFFGNRVDRLGKTHFKLEYSHTEILRNLGHNVRPDDICFKNTLSEISYEGVVKILPKITKKDSHLIPQYYLLKWKFGNIKSQLKMDKVLKMENPKDLKFIANQLKIDVSKRYNKSISKKVTALTLDSYEIINEVYKEDFERFNYE